MVKKKELTFWVTNITDRAVTLADLRFTMPARSSMDLLGKRFHYSLETLLTSYQTGSLYKKGKMVVVRKFPPQENTHTIQIDMNAYSVSRSKSVIDHSPDHFPEIESYDPMDEKAKDAADAKFAEEMADLADVK